ncbi:MAG: serine hydrolase domain-containing protein [Bacteroidota bacterium]
MRIHLYWVIILLFTVVSGCESSKPLPHAPLQEFTSYWEDRIPQVMNSYDVPGISVAILTKGTMVWSQAYGWADQENQRPLTLDAMFRVESISKSVTAWGVMQLVERGKVDLDLPVQTYLSDSLRTALLPQDAQITVRQLLAQRSGLDLGTIGEEYSPGTELPNLISYLEREMQYVYPPDTQFFYSNVGYNLLQLLIEKVTAQSFEQYMQTALFNPLGMHQSTFDWHDSLYQYMPQGYETNGQPVDPYVYPAQPSGGLIATVSDIARFAGASYSVVKKADTALLSSRSLQEMYTAYSQELGIYDFVADGYGLGHFLERLPDQSKAVWHGGQGHGWMTHFHMIPATGDGVIILANSQRSWPVIAALLTDWGHWVGVDQIKMGRIHTAVQFLWGLTITIGIGWLALLLRFITGVYSKRRYWAPWSGPKRDKRLVQFGLGIAVLVGFFCATQQPYLMVTSIFPGVAGWLGWVIVLGALLSIVMALFPQSATPNRNQQTI